MAEPHSDPVLIGALKHVAPYIPGVAGAVLSLVWGERLSPWEKTGAIGVGLVMAFWGAPGVLEVMAIWWPALAHSTSVISMTGAMLGLFGMAIATTLRRLITYVQVKIELGPLKVSERGSVFDEDMS